MKTALHFAFASSLHRRCPIVVADGCRMLDNSARFQTPPHSHSYDHLCTLQDCQSRLRRELLEVQCGLERSGLGNDGDGRCDRHSPGE